MSAAPLRLLVLCTGNSARSQIAEALINHEGRGRVAAESAGARPAERVNPFAVEVLRAHDYQPSGRTPRGLDPVADQRWDIVITVCDNAKEACPVLPGQPVQAHWGMPDPAEIAGSDEEKRRGFEEAFQVIRGRVGRLLALPLEDMGRDELRARLNEIGSG